MKIKDFLRQFDNCNPESELKIKLFEQTYYEELGRWGQESYRQLDFKDIKNNDGIHEIIFKLEE